MTQDPSQGSKGTQALSKLTAARGPMTLHRVTAAYVTESLGKEIDELFVVVAKHQILGTPRESIKEVLACDEGTLLELEADEDYRAVKGFIGLIHAQQSSDQSTSWDAIESIAVQKLVERLPYNNDDEFLLKVAAVSNKAQRRAKQTDAVLNPANTGNRTVVTLTERIIKKLTNEAATEDKTRTLSIHNGSMIRPEFSEIESLLAVEEKTSVTVPPYDPSSQVTQDDLDDFAQRFADDF